MLQSANIVERIARLQPVAAFEPKLIEGSPEGPAPGTAWPAGIEQQGDQSISLLLADDNWDFAPSASVFVVFVAVYPVRAPVADADAAESVHTFGVAGAARTRAEAVCPSREAQPATELRPISADVEDGGKKAHGAAAETLPPLVLWQDPLRAVVSTCRENAGLEAGKRPQ